jgi:UrcA family protein
MTASHNILTPTAAFALFAAAVVLTTIVPARGHGDPAILSVPYSDLDFNRPADAEILVERLQEASVPVCGGAPDYRQVERIATFEQCRRAAIQRAVTRMHQPMVSKIAAVETLGLRLAAR